jgi:hypothetical protein
VRSWYERNKHIFPANRWEAYDPEKTWEKYTVSISETVLYSGNMMNDTFGSHFISLSKGHLNMYHFSLN